MALESPLLSPPGNLMSSFSPYTDFSMSPNSPAAMNSPRFQSISARSSAEAASLRPKSLGMDDGLSPSDIQVMSPGDMVGPSPVTSHGTASTETTEIEDEASDEVANEDTDTPPTTFGAGDSPADFTRLGTLSTNLADDFRSMAEDESISVIHAPEGYGKFAMPRDTMQPPRTSDRATPTPYHHRNDTAASGSNGDLQVPGEKPSPVSPPPISTDVRPVKYGIEHQTPLAQTRQEVEELSRARNSMRSNSSQSLEGIPEDRGEFEEDEFDARTVHNSEQEIDALKMALNECWTLCNTLASLSSIHRERIFSYSGTGDAHETAWKCCWKLCQKLYDSRDEDSDLHVRPTLDLCRDFCQALFDVRQTMDEAADSVLRVSFELNNHLFNTHDRTLPEAFRERTLDFYITLCHRLMKQRNDLAEETDALLRACWSLAEMLFSLRQSKREGKAADEELLGSAVQACWELCDLFREGWTQVRPERGTPRPHQSTFSEASEFVGRPSISRTKTSSSLESLPENPDHSDHTRPRYLPQEPETPTTQFDDTPISPEGSPVIPNILVLGTDKSRPTNARWSSASSSLSGYSQGSAKSSSTVKTNAVSEDINLTRLKVLILKAAMNIGFSRTMASSTASNKFDPQALQTFVKSLPSGSFGSLPAHASLLTAYRNLVLSDPTFRNANSLPIAGKKASATDIAKSVGWMMRRGQYTFLKDLFRLVFGFHVEEAETRKNVSITV